ncbi:hypothetical protein ACLFV9_002399, partial [Clostridium perfringens]
FASVRRFILLAYVVAIHPMIEITGVLAKGIKILNCDTMSTLLSALTSIMFALWYFFINSSILGFKTLQAQHLLVLK